MNVPEISSRPIQILALFPDLAGIGGIQEAGRQTAVALTQIGRESGCELRILALNDAAGERSLRVADCELSYWGFARQKISFALAALKMGVHQSSLVIAAHPNLAPAAILPKIFRPETPVIVMAHGIEVWSPLPLIRRLALRRADGVVVPSNDTGQKVVAAQRVASGKVSRLPWPVSAQILELGQSAPSLAPPRDFPCGRVILTVGRWDASERYKGVDELLGAISLLRPSFPDLFLVAVGQGNDLPRLRRFASDLGLTESIRFFENLSLAELAACYAAADIFALPSTGEGYGLVFLEAMAFGKPVVGAACGGTTDLIQDGFNGLLVPPGRTPELAQALGRLLQDEGLRQKMGHSAAATVRARYHFDVFQIELERILLKFGLDARIPT